MTENQERQHFLQLFHKHRIYSVTVFSLGILLGWIIRPYFENPMTNVFSALTAEQWLVLVTLAYVVLTFRLVKETKKGREEDRQREIERQEREVESLRRALLAEIEQNLSKLDALDTSRTNMEFGGDVFYSEVYMGNTDRIGFLTPSEGEAVVEAFSLLLENRRLIRKGLKEDDRHGDGFTQISSTRFKRLERKLETARNELHEHMNTESMVEQSWREEEVVEAT